MNWFSSYFSIAQKYDEGGDSSNALTNYKLCWESNEKGKNQLIARRRMGEIAASLEEYSIAIEAYEDLNMKYELMLCSLLNKEKLDNDDKYLIRNMIEHYKKENGNLFHSTLLLRLKNRL